MTEGFSAAPYLDYAVGWRSGTSHIGRHAARAVGVGGDFRDFRPFWQVPDARRIDVRRSLMDPFGELMVRQAEQRSAISIFVAADFSASMRAGPEAANFAQVAALWEAIGRSAHKAGDALGFIGFDAAPRRDFYLPATRGRGAVADFLHVLRNGRAAGRSSAGMAALAPLLPARRCLVLLISDFWVPPALLETALGELAAHDVAPVVLHESREQILPDWGLMRLQDVETGRRRSMLMRPALRRRWAAARAAWRAGLDAAFARHCRPAFHVEGELDIARLGAHLLAC